MYIYNFRYHNVLKSKDLSMRTNEDIDCVFGRRRKPSKKEQVPLFNIHYSSKSQTSIILSSQYVTELSIITQI